MGQGAKVEKQPRKPRRSTEGVSSGEENSLTPKANRVHRGACPSSGVKSPYLHHFSKCDPTWLDQSSRLRLHGEAHGARALGQDSGWASGLVCWVPDPSRPLLGIGTWGDGCVYVDHESWFRRCPGGFAEGHPYQGGSSQVAQR